MTRKNSTVTVTVYRVTRANSSVNGNPAFIFHTNNGQYRTQSDLGAAYALENDFTIGTTIDRLVTLTTTPARRVTGWEFTKSALGGLIDDDVNICLDCYMDHHEGRAMKDSSDVTWTDNTNSNDEENSGITDFSSARCGCCGTTLAGARYRMAVWEA